MKGNILTDKIEIKSAEKINEEKQIENTLDLLVKHDFVDMLRNEKGYNMRSATKEIDDIIKSSKEEYYDGIKCRNRMFLISNGDLFSYKCIVYNDLGEKRVYNSRKEFYKFEKQSNVKVLTEAQRKEVLRREAVDSMQFSKFKSDESGIIDMEY